MPSITFSQGAVQTSYVGYNFYNLTGDNQLFWPNAYQNVPSDQIASAFMNILTAAATYVTTLPPATQVSVGQNFIIVNNTASNQTLNDNAGGLLVTLIPGDFYYCILSDNATDAGTWIVVNYGSNTSAPIVAALAGLGLIVNPLNAAELNTNMPISILNATPYNVVAGDNGKLFVWTTGTGNFVLPALGGTVPVGFYVSLNNEGTPGAAITVTASGGVNIDNTTSKTILLQQSAMFVAGASQWYTFGFGQNLAPVTTPLPIAQGGTGGITQQTAINNLMPSAVAGNVVYFDGTNWIVVPVGAVGQVLTLTGATTVAWGASTLPTLPVPINQGGTAATTQSAAINNLMPVSAAGSLVYFNGVTWVDIGPGTNGFVLKMVGGIPAWAAP